MSTIRVAMRNQGVIGIKNGRRVEFQTAGGKNSRDGGTGRLSIEFLQWPAGGPHAKPRLRGTGQLSIEFLGNFEIPYSPEMISKYLANIRIPPEACSQSKFSFGAW